MEWSGINERHLRSFWATLNRGSVRGAADELNVDPSVVSRHIQMLQERLGVCLFERRGRGLAPTEAAALLVEFCETRRSLEEQILMRFADTSDTLRGRIHIVSGEGFMPDLMVWALSEFGSRHPELEITLEQGGVSELINKVAQDKAHIGIAYCIEPVPPIEALISRRIPICVIAAPGHPLAAATPPISLREAFRYPIARMTTGFGLQQALSRAAAAANVTVTDRLVTNSMASLREFATLGLGISFMSARSASVDVAADRLVVLPTTSRVLNGMRVHVVVRAGRAHSRAVREIAAFLTAKSIEWEVAP